LTSWERERDQPDRKEENKNLLTVLGIQQIV
jgi:hypothetical protein